MMRIKRGPALLPWAAVVLALALTTGCGSGTKEKPAAAAPTLPHGVVPATSVPTAVPNVPELRRLVELSTCTKTAHGWSASGSVRDTGTTSKKLRITVFFTDSHATVINFASTRVTVSSNDRTTWKVSKDFKAPPHTKCVLRGVG